MIKNILTQNKRNLIVIEMRIGRLLLYCWQFSTDMQKRKDTIIDSIIKVSQFSLFHLNHIKLFMLNIISNLMEI
jgi:hypothetical protein